MRVAYLALPPIVIGGASLILPPIVWFLDFFWNWLVADNVVAIGRFERSVWNGSRPLEAFLGGAAFGVVVSGILMLLRWYRGHWLHER